jgi:hypothetical protein
MGGGIYVEMVRELDDDAPSTRIYLVKSDRGNKSNKAPNRHRKDLVQQLEKEFKNPNSNICRQTVSFEYAQAGIYQSAWIIVLYDDTDRMLGFLFAHPLPVLDPKDRSIYLDTICASKYGGMLMQLFMEKAFADGFNSVTVGALSNVLSFYESYYGFQYRPDCRNSTVSEPPMRPELQTFMKDHAAEIMENPDLLFQNPAFKKHVLRIHRKGFSVRKDNGCGTGASYSSILSNKCYENGFTMRKCFRQPLDKYAIRSHGTRRKGTSGRRTHTRRRIR